MALLIGCTRHPLAVEGARPAGHVAARLGRPGAVVAAPHGASAEGTAEIAGEVARRTGFGLVVATGVDAEPGARGGYATYERRVREAAQGPLRFYVEIDGGRRAEAAEHVEIATVGVDRDAAIKLRTLLELVRDAHLRARPTTASLAIRVEPADSLLLGGPGSRRAGILRRAERGLHVELPRVARTELRELYAAVLADFLLQAIALPPAGR